MAIRRAESQRNQGPAPGSCVGGHRFHSISRLPALPLGCVGSFSEKEAGVDLHSYGCATLVSFEALQVNCMGLRSNRCAPDAPVRASYRRVGSRRRFY